jgi:hypothetical protein
MRVEDGCVRENGRQAPSLSLFSFSQIPVLLLVINNSNLFKRISVQQSTINKEQGILGVLCIMRMN